MAKEYTGYRTPAGCAVTVHEPGRAADVLGDDGRARDVYQRLKAKVVAGLPKDGWTLTEGRLRAALAAIERERGRDR